MGEQGAIRLVAMTAEDAARLRLIADHPDNDLSPNDHGLLLALADARFDGGITAEDVRYATYSIDVHSQEHNQRVIAARHKLRGAFS